MRYMQLLKAVREKQPRAILEIGTWNGGRALEMLALCPTARYYGFDLFEEATRETDHEEMNVKPHYTLEAVENRLEGYQATLYKGNTRVTLPAFEPDVKPDFVWLDGGHSIETIRSDFEEVKRVVAPDAWIFLDDYYEGPIDTGRFGCNALIRGYKHEILPDADRVSGGGTVQMVRVWL